mgnify:FL=1
MERGIYFDGWYRDNHCYHPSLPFRSMRMVEDLEKYKGTILVWSVMGGGSISLPYLENEAFGEVDPRLRFYGYMNDAEFIAECNKRGIKTMGIVFEVQGWEFPVTVSEDGRSMKQFNVIREGEAADTYGLNEFASGKFDGLFRTSLKDYYPQGIFNSDGERVTDLQEEVAARTFRGEPVHAQWVEVVGHSKTCYQTCRNNPVWREYLKKIMELQIDAGVAGIQLDEAELPITSMGAGGCFCKDCRKQFRAYLQKRKAAGSLSPVYEHIDLERFDYQEYILEKGYASPEESPMFRDYYEFQMRAVKKHFTELADHAREYARRTQNKEILVSGNFFNCMPVYYPFEDKVDVIITEMEKTLFRQPHWYRYISGYSNTKPVIVAENPYGGIVPQLLEMLEAGQGYDLYRLFLLEASVYGCNMSVPYGGWMGNTIKNAFYPPASVTAQVQGFLAEHEEYYSKDSSAMIMVAYSFPSYYWREVTKSGGANALVEDESILFYKSLDMESEGASRLPFWEVIHLMSDRQVIYDVRMFGDEDLRPDRVDVSQWQQYELIVLPECDFLTANQREELEKYIDRGGRLLMFGKTAENCPGWARQMAEKKNVIICANPASRGEAMELFGQVFEELNDRIAQVKVKVEDVSLQNFVGVHCHRNHGVNTIHLLNYHYDRKEDRVQPIEHVSLEARIPSEATSVRCMDLDGKEIPCQARAAQGRLTVKLEKLPLYAVVEIRC